MPNKTVPAWTQVPVQAKDIVQESHTRLNAAGTLTDVTVTYQILDNLGVVRQTKQTTFQGGAYPTPGATIVAACNTAEGT